RSADSQWNPVLDTISDLAPKSFEQVLIELQKRIETDADKKFRANNAELCLALKEEIGIKALVEHFDRLAEADRRVVRDVFVYVVHTFSNRRRKSYTPFVSTTPIFDRAEHFAGTGCVMCAYLPTTQAQRRVLRSKDLAKYCKAITSL